jgi:hypothetical protein
VALLRRNDYLVALYCQEIVPSGSRPYCVSSGPLRTWPWKPRRTQRWHNQVGHLLVKTILVSDEHRLRAMGQSNPKRLLGGFYLKPGATVDFVVSRRRRCFVVFGWDDSPRFVVEYEAP